MPAWLSSVTPPRRFHQVEVDEFLDEVVSTIYALQVENQDLKEKLEAAERRIAELFEGVASEPVVVEPVAVEKEKVEEEIGRAHV